MTTTRPLLKQDQAAAYLLETWNFEMKVSTLQTKRTSGEGPRYTRNGRTPLYDPDDLDAWVKAQPKYEAVIDEPWSETQKAARANEERKAG
ncbi:hypothetical protein [Aliiruegeria lutimaris]|uniref:Helix-turn-helix domain-containing protein n=1 Tax=Aliiruegeria lutimaris TaxID=571298 RepID=A0A1G8KJM1_9RHOB|nr:hypothetical protein [Aliiruegeria lutimaris]SDI43647.1 hypothetical protein SAMN04488026_100310 [Aliiruegeria lutimaris]